jgi:hypothetical protein
MIEIHPKADKEEDDNKWKGVLLQMLKACGKLKAESAVVWFIILAIKWHLNFLIASYRGYTSNTKLAFKCRIKSVSFSLINRHKIEL